jgi:hypothetical protein
MFVREFAGEAVLLTLKHVIGEVRIYMFERESHGPPHVHVWCDKEVRGLIAIENLEVISDQKLPSGCLKLVRAWMKERQDELMTFWWEARERQRQGGNKP